MHAAQLDGLSHVLCLGAHADDIEIGCGGTLLKWLSEREGLHVTWVVLGAAGVRADEAAASAARFLKGAARNDVVVKGFRDSFFPYEGPALKEFVHELAGRVEPDVVFTHRREDAHQDHRVVAELTWCAFRNHLVLEYEIPKYEGDLGQPNLYVPLDEPICRKKIELLREGFPSQQEKTWFRDETFWSLLRLRGIESGGTHDLAEAFTCRKLTLD